ncbi:hypothetical protein COCC4DRAFT_144377 [Bipolaris maydis ATCC 48331]|uniref:Uncharacterized protein n=2 Tax=Cochliobolus heterostrophus TaxID=5016 RepID=M2VCT2_COCH5|nr:uncharacterized protein COCC4DRAFT_144377 [Bipolaris maydis ATCC 48331]EMD97822.1 hypothetical protein COCHEDRAFT_1209599 [Bipolaris maydis C5]ENI02781.1 hypothetical protein COCC4DRAFT_144377 [Bipolaris maydis ATCC 48331]KAH7564489.1 hypothetical protein BM1_01536 [Bipolaris maydis]
MLLLVNDEREWVATLCHASQKGVRSARFDDDLCLHGNWTSYVAHYDTILLWSLIINRAMSGVKIASMPFEMCLTPQVYYA